jgi:hypothetical protein
MEGLAPISVSVYTRLETFKKCIEALKKNPLAIHSDLYVISDASGRENDDALVKKVRDYAKRIIGFKKVNLIFREKNIGGFESCIQAEKIILERHGKIIFLEDDVIVSKSFLSFLNESLSRFKDDQKVFSISAYCPPVAYAPLWNNRVLSAPFHCPWGYATWLDRYQAISPRFNPYPLVIRDKALVNCLIKNVPFMLEALREDYFNPDLGYADVRLTFQVMLRKMESLYPACSLTRNIGLDGFGTRMPRNDELAQQLICDNYEVLNWEKVVDVDFQSRLVKNGMKPSQLQFIVLFLYRTGMREHLNFIITAARKLKKFLN